ncbi:MAG: hypothetical protein Q9159_005608 [Coniocarpon cinnabarinum]
MPRLRYRTQFGGSSDVITAAAGEEVEDSNEEGAADDETGLDASGGDSKVFQTVKELLEERILLQSSAVHHRGPKSGRSGRKRTANTNTSEFDESNEELGEFIEYLAHELYENLPEELQRGGHSVKDFEDVSNVYVLALDLSLITKAQLI